MGKAGRGRLRKPSVYANRPLRQLTVTARPSLLHSFSLSCLEPSFYLSCVFENALTPVRTATDAGGNKGYDSEIVNIETDLKLGNFALSFTDLQIPVAGIPITVTRTYDTLNAQRKGDFGYGWTLDVAMPEAKVIQGSLGYGGTFTNGTRVVITTPEGNEEGFNFKWVPVSSNLDGIGKVLYYGPSFEGDPGNQYELIPPNNGHVFTKLTENSFTVAGDGREYRPKDPFFSGFAPNNYFQLNETGPGTRGLSYNIAPVRCRGLMFRTSMEIDWRLHRMESIATGVGRSQSKEAFTGSNGSPIHAAVPWNTDMMARDDLSNSMIACRPND